MKIAVPTVNGRLSEHFGHCEQFVIVEIDSDTRQMTNTEMMIPPVHQPGVLPEWLSGLGVTIVIAGGIGGRAVQIFAAKGIEVLSGAPIQTPEELAASYLSGNLVSSGSLCEGGQGHGGCDGHH